jgi:hypothetical protein
MNQSAPPVRRAERFRLTHSFALLLALTAIALPDCCLNGSHSFGRGMDGFGVICHARL